MLRVEVNAGSVIDSINAYIKTLDKQCEKVTGEMSNKGYELVSNRLDKAVYDGDLGEAWPFDDKRGAEASVGIEGPAAAFIEFGTGVYYPDDHPKAAEVGAVRGSYGKHQGLNPPWTYYGKPPGSNGVVIPSKHGRLVVQTMGNPANKVVYNTARDLEKIAPDKVKEVFGKK